MTFDPTAEPCFTCGREIDECMCPCHPAFDDDFDPLDELTGYDPDWDDYEKGDLDYEHSDPNTPPTMP